MNYKKLAERGVILPPSLELYAVLRMPAEPPAVLRKIAVEMEKRRATPRTVTGSVTPCVSLLLDKMLSAAERGEKIHLSHRERFFLATLLHEAGISIDEALCLYAVNDDYNEKVTRYQLNHIYTHGYSVPRCENLEGICPERCGKSRPHLPRVVARAVVEKACKLVST